MSQRKDKLKEMLQASPDDCFLHHALGLEYLKEGNIEEGIQHFHQVLLLNEDYVGTYYHLAKALFEIRKKEEAMKIFEQGIVVATKVKDLHARNELQMAMEELEDE